MIKLHFVFFYIGLVHLNCLWTWPLRKTFQTYSQHTSSFVVATVLPSIIKISQSNPPSRRELYHQPSQHEGNYTPTLHHEGNYTPNPPSRRELYPWPSIMKGIIPPTLHHEGNYTPNPPSWRELYPQPSIMKGIIPPTLHHEGNYTLNPPSWRELLITIYLQDYKPDDKTIKKSKNSLKLMNPLLLASTNINMLRTNNDVGFSWSASANSVLVSWISAICLDVSISSGPRSMSSIFVCLKAYMNKKR